MTRFASVLGWSIVGLCTFAATVDAADKELSVQARRRVETAAGSNRFHVITTPQQWPAAQTAIIVCDMWDSHHCLNAVRRVGELVPRMNDVLGMAREQGALIIHAPSSCMAAYENHPARARAIAAPTAKNLPSDIAGWCRHIPAEAAGQYPIDQTQGGEDDEPAEHAAWAALLTSRGLNPRAPWKRQVAGLQIDDERDVISDSGVEIWNVLEARGIRNVVLLGVHTNMCVLGRPFGLRQLAQHGKNVVLMRDMTDTMYDPTQWPRVSHFSGTDLIVEHIEKYVCPTITSVDLLEDDEFRFAHDRRPHVVLLVAEDEYKTEQTLPEFVDRHLRRDFQVTIVYGSEADRNDLPGIDEAVSEADVLLVSVRRRTLPTAQLAWVRQHVALGKPVVGIRTSNHAFAPGKNQKPGEGQDAWLDWDAQVFGGSYTGHHGEGPKVTLTPAEASSHPLLTGVEFKNWLGHGSLYKVNPLAAGVTPLVIGTIADKPAETIAWTRIRSEGGRSFYTSLGHVDDFQTPSFRRLLLNSIYWSAGLPIPMQMPFSPAQNK